MDTCATDSATVRPCLQSWASRACPRSTPATTSRDDRAARRNCADDDIVVVTSKIVSKAEGRIVELATVEPSPFATEWSTGAGTRTPAVVEVVLREARRIVRMSRTGADHRDAPRVRVRQQRRRPVVERRRRPRRAAARAIRTHRPARIRARFAELGVDVAVIISDTFGRPWREGQTDVAIGIAGIAPMHQLHRPGRSPRPRVPGAGSCASPTSWPPPPSWSRATSAGAGGGDPRLRVGARRRRLRSVADPPTRARPLPLTRNASLGRWLRPTNVPSMTATAEEFAGPTTELLQSLIRNECVNDGTPDSGDEIRNAELLAVVPRRRRPRRRALRVASRPGARSSPASRDPTRRRRRCA